MSWKSKNKGGITALHENVNYPFIIHLWNKSNSKPHKCYHYLPGVQITKLTFQSNWTYCNMPTCIPSQQILQYHIEIKKGNSDGNNFNLVELMK